jgi:hypothetical protein
LANVADRPILLKNSVSIGAKRIAGPKGMRCISDVGETRLRNARHQEPSECRSGNAHDELAIEIQFGKKMQRVHFRVFQQNRPQADIQGRQQDFPLPVIQ